MDNDGTMSEETLAHINAACGDYPEDKEVKHCGDCKHFATGFYTCINCKEETHSNFEREQEK